VFFSCLLLIFITSEVGCAGNKKEERRNGNSSRGSGDSGSDDERQLKSSRL
jgi:hypothetical protein